MNIETIKIKNKYIELNKFLKYIGKTSSGGQTKIFLEENNVLINGEKAKFKRQKLTNKTKVKINDTTYLIETE